ncbi:MAG: hypothetical protein IIY49_11085 [Eubacterium sp.]|nr:hypothetical protein [Eubacterium sp.]
MSKEKINESDSGKITEKKSLAERIISIIALIILFGLIGWLIYAIVTGSDLILAILFVNVIYAFIVYIFLWLKKVFSKY